MAGQFVSSRCGNRRGATLRVVAALTLGVIVLLTGAAQALYSSGSSVKTLDESSFKDRLAKASRNR